MSSKTFFRSLLLLLVGAALVLSGCDVFGDDDDGGGAATPLAGNVVVGNGGTFGADNGALTFYDAATGVARTKGVGGFVTGLTVEGDRLYATLNSGISSGGFGIVDLEAVAEGQDTTVTTVTRAGGRRIGALRALAFTRDGRAYATDFAGGGQATGFSFDDKTVRPLADTTTALVAYPEGIAVAAGKVFAANYDSSSFASAGEGRSLVVFEPGQAEEARIVPVPCDGPRELFVDEQDELVVLCAGRTVYGEPDAPENSSSRVLFIDPETEEVVDRIALDVQIGSANGSQAASYSPVAQVLHAISSGSGQILRIDTEHNALGGPPIDVPDTEGYVGLAAVTYDSGEDRLYVARLALGPDGSADYGARGQGVVLNGGTGAVVGTFPAGIAPTSIALIE